MIKQIIQFATLGILLLAAMTGCTKLASPLLPPTDRLHMRVTAVWNAKTVHDWGAVYDAATEESRSKMKKDRFINHANVKVLDYSIESIEISPSGDKALVSVQYSVMQNGYTFNHIQSKDEWIWEKNEWRINLLPYFDAGKKPFSNAK